MAVTDISPPPQKQDPKFDNWMHRLWLRARASVDFATIGATSPILATTGTGTIGLSHATSGVVAGTYGGASAIPVMVVNTYGHITSGTTTSVSGGVITQNIQNGNYTLVAGDANKHIYREGTATGLSTWSIPANGTVAYDVGTPISFVNEGTGNVTIAIISDTLVFYGTGATGSRTLSQYGWASALKITSTRWAISGVGLT